jgi:hypothetical protein
MPRKRTPTRRQNPRKVVAAPQRWPYEYEHTKYPDPDDEYDSDIIINHVWARDAIFHGKAEPLARYLRETDEIDPRIRRELAKMLDPTSNHDWRLDPQYRFRGVPAKQAKNWKTTFIKNLLPLAKLLSGTDPMDTRCHRTLAEMLDPESQHELRLVFKQRKRGRPPLEKQSKYRPVHVPAAIEDDPATLIARRAERVRSASKTGPKVPLKQLRDGASAATINRRLQRRRKAK